MSKDAKILIVEDEPHINRLIEIVLISDGYYKIKKAFDGAEALSIIRQDKPDLILLDVLIPEIDGYTLCRTIKNDTALKSIQVIMLTAKKTDDDILKGFESGATDYITKPFKNKILLARVNAHLQNSRSVVLPKQYRDFTLDEYNMSAQINNTPIKLTRFEFELMRLFISNVGRVYSRSQILTYLKGDNSFEVSERAVDVQILNLRKKLGAFGSNIETIRGVGYRLKEIPDE